MFKKLFIYIILSLCFIESSHANLDIKAKSRWPLDKSAPFMKGPGLKL